MKSNACFVYLCYARTEPSNFSVKLVGGQSWFTFRDLFSVRAVPNDCNLLLHKLRYNAAKRSLFPGNT